MCPELGDAFPATLRDDLFAHLRINYPNYAVSKAAIVLDAYDSLYDFADASKEAWAEEYAKRRPDAKHGMGDGTTAILFDARAFVIVRKVLEEKERESKAMEAERIAKAKAGENGAATAGENGAATSRGSACVGKNGIGCVRGNGVKVKGGLGSILVIAVEQESSYNIKEWKVIQIDGEKYKADTWYTLRDGEIVEVKEDDDER